MAVINFAIFSDFPYFFENFTYVNAEFKIFTITFVIVDRLLGRPSTLTYHKLEKQSNIILVRRKTLR